MEIWPRTARISKGAFGRSWEVLKIFLEQYFLMVDRPMKGGCVIGCVIKLEEGKGWTYNWESLEKMELGEK